jgi:membrane protein
LFLAEKLLELYKNANRSSGGRLNIPMTAWTAFTSARASQAAASLAYYAIFSLFPLLLVLIAGGSYFLDSQQIQRSITRFVQDVIPVSPQMINENLTQILETREAVGIISILTLLWSASGFFTSLAYNINLAWPEAPRRNFLEKRLVGVGMIIGLCALLILSLTLTWITNLILFLNIENASSRSLDLLMWFSNQVAWLMLFLLFTAIYRWVPTTKVPWSAALWSALFASTALKLGVTGFDWYLQSGFGRYQLVYGSLGAIVALLFLIFLVSLITLFGAHLSAAIDLWKRRHELERNNTNGYHES